MPRDASCGPTLPEHVRGVCFDVDGTLYDGRALRLAMTRKLLRHYAFRPLQGRQVARICLAWRRALERIRDAADRTACEDIRDEQIRVASEISGVSRETVAQCVRVWFEEEPLALLPQYLRPGLTDFLSKAARRGIKLAVLSDYPAKSKLDAMGIMHYFDAVVSAQDRDVQKLKPHPDGLLHALRRIGVSAAEAVYIGDRSEVDAETARRAGVTGALIGRPRRMRSSSTIPPVFPDFFQLAESVFA